MDKRLIIAIALCVVILGGWYTIVPKFFPSLAPAKPTPAEQQKTAAAPPAAENAPTAPPVAAAGTPAAPGTAPAAAGVAPGNFARVEKVIATPVERFVFTNQGAALIHAQLLEAKYLKTKGDPQSGVDLVRTSDPKLAPFHVSFPGSGFPTPAESAWQVVTDAPAPPAGTEQIVYRADVGGIRVEKRFVVDKTRYRLHLEVSVENRSATPVDHHLAIALAGYQDPDTKGGFFSGSRGDQSTLLCRVDDKVSRVTADKAGSDPYEKTGAASWIGSDEKFFLMAAVPYPETPAAPRTCKAVGVGQDTGTVTLSFAERTLAPGKRTLYPFAVFVGPKVVDDLDQVRPGGEDVKLTEAVDVTLAFISRPMLMLLQLFHRFVGNWGLAIILLTLFIRLVTFYPTQKSLLSAKRMQKLGPKMAVIRKKYENDKARQSQETMKLYKQEGVSPFGGCLPSLIQMPIWIALYSTLNYAVDLYREPFIFHIHDLTAKDPYYITPLLMGGVMFIQMKMSPTSPDNQQQAMMALMMPIMFTAFSLVLPAGLAVYMLTSYLIGILQQLWINHLDRKANAKALPVPAAKGAGG